MEVTDYENLKVHPIFEPIKKLLEFYILGIAFVGQFEFQEVLLKNHPEFKPFINRYNAEVNLRREGLSVKSQTKTYMVGIGRTMAIAFFDILQSSEYQNDLCEEYIFKFAKHIRNGAAHNNRFNIVPAIESEIHWRDKIIKNELNGTLVIPDFINPMMLIPLMSDISELIYEKHPMDNGDKSA